MERLLNKAGFITMTALALLLLAALATVARGGPLDPPAAPGSTQETLLFQPADCAGFPVTIGSPGSYKLAQNIEIPSSCAKNGIQVSSSYVSIDLAGFTVKGNTGSLEGIHAGSIVNAVSVSSGIVRAWGAAGISATGSNNSFADLKLLNNGGKGLEAGSDSLAVLIQTLNNGSDEMALGDGSTIQNCNVDGAGSAGKGISAGQTAVVSGCVVRNNGADEISVGDKSVVTDCSVDGSDTDGSGIVPGSDVSISNCVIRANGHPTIPVSVVPGVAAGTADRIQIRDCVISGNTGHGISVRHDAIVSHNAVTGNGGHGIFFVGNGSVASDNNVTSNGGYGIQTTGLNNEVYHNNAGGNVSGNYLNNGGGSDFGPIGVAATATSPWANISH